TPMPLDHRAADEPGERVRPRRHVGAAGPARDLLKAHDGWLLFETAIPAARRDLAMSRRLRIVGIAGEVPLTAAPEGVLVSAGLSAGSEDQPCARRRSPDRHPPSS